MNGVKEHLAVQASRSAEKVRLTKNMNIRDMIVTLEPEIRKALPEVMTPERFTRIAISAVNTTPKLAECTQISVLAALMNAAQLGLECNTPLGQAYLIPYLNKRKNTYECQFIIGYKGLLDLAYRNPEFQTIQAQTVYENDEFDYALGLDSYLRHKPVLDDRGEVRCFYSLYKLQNGGYAFCVMSKADIDRHANRFSKSVDSASSPWATNYEAMAMKTCVRQLLKMAPLRTDLQKALSMDGAVKNDLSVDMSEVQNEDIFDQEEEDMAA